MVGDLDDEFAKEIAFAEGQLARDEELPRRGDVRPYTVKRLQPK